MPCCSTFEAMMGDDSYPPVDSRPSPLVPPLHLLRAALHVGGLIDEIGAPTHAVRRSYSQVPTDGVFGTADLLQGQQILLRAGLLEYAQDRLARTSTLTSILALQREQGLELLVERLLAAKLPLWLQVAGQGV